MDAEPAIATSLLVVGVTSAIGAITHARAHRVRWRVAVLFGLAAMAGAYAGGMLARFVPGTVLLIAFAVIMIAAGGRDAARPQGHHQPDRTRTSTCRWSGSRFWASASA